ncbi:MAG: DUF2817 domain-containing protein [Bdellovibrionaceae bacterium]|nr:DUF2817 domain-containing protein [Bdellovibrionales bacterium]MCB9083554.1 DUF2817 domain-containing protein [Pseudobdellovibrionaceae bacterium]
MVLLLLLVGPTLPACSNVLPKGEPAKQALPDSPFDNGEERAEPSSPQSDRMHLTEKKSGTAPSLADKQKKESAPVQPSSSATRYSPEEVASICYQSLKGLPGQFNQKELKEVCQKTLVMDGCSSEQDRPIFHYDRPGRDSEGKRILTLSLIHGDEYPSGSVARAWIARLERLNPRNSWRVIPVMNPDGLRKGTRTNARGVDLNRNFPTKNWDDEALHKWKTLKKEDPRRYPGPYASSEVETRCAVKHIEEFKPDFIISIHTPLGVLDFDGPKVKYPHFKPLPWISLGHFPGSLGRYMWKDRNIPVLTIELKGDRGMRHLEQFDRLQDISGTVAIQADEAKTDK